MIGLGSTSGARSDAGGLRVVEIAAVRVDADAIATVAVLRSSSEGLVVPSTLLE